MQKDLGFPADFSLPLSRGQFRARALTPVWVAELQAVAADPRIDDELIVREAMRRVSVEPRGEAERIAADATGEDLERFAEALVENHPWLVGGGPSEPKMARRFESEAHAAHFRRALLWHRAHGSKPALPVAAPYADEIEEAAPESPSPASPLDERTLRMALWGVLASVALSATAAGLAALTYFDARNRHAAVEREQRNAFDAIQQQLNANNAELRGLKRDMQAKAPAPEPPPAKAPAKKSKTKKSRS